jgi:hypothetical protein
MQELEKTLMAKFQGVDISIPDIPQHLNPKGLKVEISSFGEKLEGDWSLCFCTTDSTWKISSGSDCEHEIRARLIESTYWFLNEQKTKKEISKILAQEYELVESPANGPCCDECPFFDAIRARLTAPFASGCRGSATTYFCGRGKQWRKKHKID